MGFFGDLRQDLSQVVSELMPSDSNVEEKVTKPKKPASLSLDEMLRNIDAIQLSEEDSRALTEETPRVEEPAEEPITLGSVDIASMLEDIQAREEAYGAELNLEDMEAVFPEPIFAEDGQPQAVFAESLDREEPVFAETAGEFVFAEGAEEPVFAEAEEKPVFADATIGEPISVESVWEETVLPESGAEQMISEDTSLWESEKSVQEAVEEPEVVSAERPDKEPVLAETPVESVSAGHTIEEQETAEAASGEYSMAGQTMMEPESAETKPVEYPFTGHTIEAPIFAEGAMEVSPLAESASEESVLPASGAGQMGLPETELLESEALVPAEEKGREFVFANPAGEESEPTALEDISEQPDEGFTENSMKEEKRMFEEKTEMQPAEEAVFGEAMVGDTAGDAVQGLSEEAANNINEEEKGAEDIMDTYSTREALDETSVITSGMTITGDVTSEGSIDIVGKVNGNISALGKLNITGHINGNSKASEVYAEGAKINGEIVSEGAVKIGASTVIIGNITAVSAAIAGAVKGDIDVKGPVVLDASAIVMGNIKSKSVQINNGAVIEGMCSQCYADVSPTAFFEDYKPEKKKTSITFAN